MRELAVSRTQDRRANFDAVIGPHLDAGYRTALAILRDPDLAQDAVQESAFKAWRKLHQLREGKPARPWFLAIVANHCRSERRSHWWSVIRMPAVESITREMPNESVEIGRALARCRAKTALRCFCTSTSTSLVLLGQPHLHWTTTILRVSCFIPLDGGPHMSAAECERNRAASLPQNTWLIGFSGDDSLALVSTTPLVTAQAYLLDGNPLWIRHSTQASMLEVIDIRSGQVVWRGLGSSGYSGFVAHPDGRDFAISFAATNTQTGSTPSTILIIHGDGSVTKLPQPYLPTW